MQLIITIDLLPSTATIAGLILLCSTEDEFDFGRLSKSNATKKTKNVINTFFFELQMYSLSTSNNKKINKKVFFKKHTDKKDRECET